jgi:Protein of unknown function (DUF3761)
MRLLLLVAVALAVGISGAAAAPPPGATALCRDGTYSYSKHHSGTCSHHGGVKRWLDGSGSRGSSGGGSGGVKTGRTILLGHRTQTSDCVRSARPDRKCSPGAYYSRLTKRVICSSSFHTSAIRNVPQSEKFRVEREYGMAAAYYGHTIEIDHIIPLELGGSNAIANLFPEPGSGTANYHVKDAVEDRAAAEVCDGRLSLHTARQGFARNWEALYRRLFGHAPN